MAVITTMLIKMQALMQNYTKKLITINLLNTIHWYWVDKVLRLGRQKQFLSMKCN